MCKYIKVVFFCVLLSQLSYSQPLKSIYGFVYDSLSVSPLINASVYIENVNTGTYTNESGWFSLDVETDTAKVLHISYMGYAAKKIKMKEIFNEHYPLRIYLAEMLFEADEVVVRADKFANEKKLSDLGYHQLTNKDIKYLPAVGGESDPLKILQLLPGISTSKEGSAEIHVRGGENDQNLILIDGVQVYNPMHVFGYFSTFNPDAINSVELMKGYISPEYNGRISSVISYHLNDGNNAEKKYSGGISLLSSQFQTEGPLASNITYMLSARRSYLDPVFELLSNSDGLSFSFTDLYAKLSWQPSQTDRVYLSSYYGGDNLSINSSDTDTKLSWTNAVANLRWNRIWNSKIFSNTSLIYSRYSSGLSRGEIYKDPFVNDLTFKSAADYRISPWNFLQFGGEIKYCNFNVTSGIQELSNLNSYAIRSLESNLYVLDQLELLSRIKLNLGLSFSGFAEAKTGKSFFNYDPRFALSYQFDDNSSVKSSFTRLHQYIHQLSSVNLYNPADVFYPSNINLPPVTGNQISLGFTKIIRTGNSGIAVDLDAYYRDMQNLPMFRQNFKDADPFLLSEQIILGRGWGYGLEFQIEKREGKLSGWLNYTWNRSFRQFGEKNKGRSFNPKFHIEHQLNLALSYNLSTSLKINAVFVISSGRPITLPNQKFFVIGEEHNTMSNIGELDYGAINDYRLPLYQRLDLGIVHPFTMWKGKWELFVNIYNIYNHQNNTFITYENANGKFYSFTVGILPTAGIKFYY